jgi:hypothetical protein
MHLNVIDFPTDSPTPKPKFVPQRGTLSQRGLRKLPRHRPIRSLSDFKNAQRGGPFGGAPATSIPIAIGITAGPERAKNSIFHKLIKILCPSGVPCPHGGYGSSPDSAPIFKTSFEEAHFKIIFVADLSNSDFPLYPSRDHHGSKKDRH